MAKRRKKKSKASREKRIAKRREKRARRKAMPAGLKKYWAKKRGKKSHARKHRPSRKSRMKRRKSRSRARKTRHVAVSKAVSVVVRKRRGSRGRLRVKRRGKRGVSVGVNAGAMTMAGGFTQFLPNLKATMKDGIKGFAFAFGGAAVSVAGGAFTSQVTGNILGRFAPGLLANPIVSRLLGAVNYYLPGWAAAKFIPGISGKSRRAMLTGAAAAALVEVIKPGLVRSTLQRVPVVGGLLGSAEDTADDLGAYVGYALNGLGAGTNDSHTNGGYAAIYEDTRDQNMGEYLALGDYAQVDSDAAQNVGVAGLGEYVELR